ncbi:flagellar assembly protein FliH [Gracilibacillus sp. S3-1-1]|uniref:Flagellar assembly protein FliH n=1 Tax=Gracilibacillus pellucidus TaxID=3095368 RepID=A0ACC6M7R4_9BACI|nr:flagellar assembly protein FliH [Gracilibacillus sp. S3-1-1]MDX8046936.1 flagellar assembly protein FliH [Gracilibacillus sp. S3-1-1]
MSNHSLPTRQIGLRKIEQHSVEPFDSKEVATSSLHTIYQQLEEAKKQYQETLNQIEHAKQAAQDEVTQLREAWEEEKIQYIERAQQEGYQQGFEQGKEDSLREFRQIISEATDVLNTAREEYHKIIAESDETVLHVALSVAEKVIKQSIAEDNDKFIGIAQSLIEQVKEHPTIKLFVASKYYSLLMEHKDELAAIIHNQAEFTIYPTPELQEEQIMIESPYGRIDASVDSQLEEIRNKLFHLVEEITRENTDDIE